ncbi:MAG: radical SAM protein [Candidatus Lokiarchaeota archaeon]|nr:radical SAM protein [Candidatus Lokiarchaeota archaeon]
MINISNIIKKTQSLCPECKKTIDADIIEKENEVLMIKNCKEHGHFEDLLSINPEHFKWSQKYRIDGQKVDNPCVPTKNGCPNDCGACPNHMSSPAIAIVDVTYRCNLKCPICFANAEAKGMNYEPSYDELIRIFKHMRAITPQPPVCAMFAGGEPTMRNDLADIISECIEMGFLQIQIATNGIRLNNIDYFQELIDAGIPKNSKDGRSRTVIYLQFDGIERDTYLKTRGVDILDKKLKVVENARALDFQNMIIVPTIAKGVNDHEVTNILQFCIDNIDVINTLMYQPMAMCGRYDKDKLKEMRITSSHLAKDLIEYTNGAVGKTYPLPVISKFAKCIAWFSDQPPVEFTCSQDCGFANFMFVDPKTKNLIGIDEFIDSEEFLDTSAKWYERVEREKKWEREGKEGFLERGIFKRARKEMMRARFFADISRHLKPIREVMGKFSNPMGIISNFAGTIFNTSWEASANWLVGNNILLVGLMHFQDLYNFDVNRVNHCLVHYGYVDPATDTVRQIPFCAMNAIHRERIEDELEAGKKMVQYVPELKTPE